MYNARGLRSMLFLPVIAAGQKSYLVRKIPAIISI